MAAGAPAATRIGKKRAAGWTRRATGDDRLLKPRSPLGKPRQLARTTDMAYATEHVAAQRSGLPWCAKPVYQLDPEPCMHPTVFDPGREVLEVREHVF